MALETKATDAAFATLLRWQPYLQQGLTKREYFAAMALQGLLARSGVYALNTKAYIAVEAADELIKQLNQHKLP